MRRTLKNKLQLNIEFLEGPYYGATILSFKIEEHLVKGVLQGSSADWYFQSASKAFLKYVPSGTLQKYMLWTDNIPEVISEVYNGIAESAIKAGFDIEEKEELIA